MPDRGTTLSRQMKVQHLCWVLYLSGFLDFCGVGMIMPLIPTRFREVGASTTVTGLIGSVYGGVQLLSSPVMGKWADTVSRRTSLLLSLGMSSFGYLLLGSSTAVFILVASRALLGTFKHGQTLSKACLSDIIPEKERSAVLGRFNSFSSIGLIIGPILGGHIAETSGGFSLVAMGTSLFFCLNSGLVWLLVPDTNSDKMKSSNPGDSERNLMTENGKPSEGKQSMREDTPKSSTETSSSSYVLLAYWDLFLMIFFASFAMLLYRANNSLLLKEKLMASPKTLGYITSYTGLVSTLCGFCVGKIIEWYKNNDAKLLLHVTVFQALVLLCLSMAPSIPYIIVFLAPLSIITSIARVTTTSITIQRCGQDKVASVMGWSMSVTSTARMMAPFVAGVTQEWSMDLACYISVLGVCASLIIMLVKPQGPNAGKKQRML